MTEALRVLAAVGTGACVLTALALLHRPRRRLAGRVRPYAVAATAALGRATVAAPVRTGGPAPDPWRAHLGRLLQAGTPDPVLQARLAQAGLYRVADADLVAEHRIRQVLLGLAGAGLGLVAGVGVGLGVGGSLGLAVLGVVAGGLRPTAAVDAAIEQRRDRLRAEVPALCHLLALRLRASGSVVQAMSHTIARSRGQLVGELADALAQHRAGRPLEEALDAVALATPEPEAARVHRLLAGAISHGLDVAPELLRLSAEVRQTHLTRLRRQATARRAAILLPTVGILAPLMLLFIAAPLPSLVLGS